MFDGISNGVELIGAAIKAAFRYPALILPLIFVWAIYAPMVVYLKFYLDWEALETLEVICVLFGFICLLSISFSASSFFLLEQLRRIETGRKIDWFSPVSVAARNVWRALPVTLTWVAVWFLITCVEIIVRRPNGIADQHATPENIARTLGGAEGFALSGTFFNSLQKGVRMIAFSIFPAFAWENHKEPIRRGFAVVNAHKGEFAAGFILTEVAAVLVFLPPGIIFLVSDYTDYVISDDVWFAVIVYCGFAWSFSMLLEQLFTAELYLWDLKWREACREAEQDGKEKPTLQQTPKPSLLDGIPDLLGMKTLWLFRLILFV